MNSFTESISDSFFFQADHVRMPLENDLEQRRPRPRKAEQEHVPDGARAIRSERQARLPIRRRALFEQSRHGSNVLERVELVMKAMRVLTLQLFVARGVRKDRLFPAILRIQNVAEEPVRIGALERRNSRVGEQRANPRLGLELLPLPQLRRGKTHHRIGKPRQPGQRFFRPHSSFRIDAAAARDMRETRQGDAMIGVELDRAAEALLRAADLPHRQQRVAPTGMRKRQRRVQLEQRIELLQRLGGPLEAQQTQTERVARTLVARSDLHRAIEQPLRLDRTAFLLEIQGNHVQQQRMLQAADDRGACDRPGLRVIAALRRLVDRV